MAKKLINVITSVLIIVTTWVIYSKISVKPEKPKLIIKDLGIPVRIAKATKSDEKLSMKLWGEVQYRRKISLKSEVEGRVLSVSENFRPGNSVKKGQLLAIIDSGRLQQKRAELMASRLAGIANIDQLKIEHETLNIEIQLALANVDLAKEDVERHEKLLKNNNASQLTLSSFKQTLIRQKSIYQQLISRAQLIPKRIAVAEAQVKSIEASISLIERDIKDSKVKAPFDGKISGSVVDTGDYLRKGELICNLFDPSWYEVWVNIAVAEKKRLGGISEIFYNDKSINEFRYLGELEKGIQADSLIFEVHNAGLKAGELIQVDVYGEVLKDVFVIPESALRNDRKSIYLVKEGKLVTQQVKTLFINQGKAYLASGLSEGDQYVTDRLNDFPDGTKVTTGNKSK